MWEEVKSSHGVTSTKTVKHLGSLRSPATHSQGFCLLLLLLRPESPTFLTCLSRPSLCPAPHPQGQAGTLWATSLGLLLCSQSGSAHLGQQERERAVSSLYLPVPTSPQCLQPQLLQGHRCPRSWQWLTLQGVGWENFQPVPEASPSLAGFLTPALACT